MTGNSENTLIDVSQPRWWVRKIRFLRELWDNPIFQRCYRRNRVIFRYKPFPSFLVGFAYSLLLGVVFFLVFKQDYTVFITLLSTCVIGLLVIILLVMVVYTFTNCVVRLSIDMHSDIARGGMLQTLTAPVSDSDIYFGECLTPFVRGAEIVVSLVCFALGTVPPYMAAVIFGLLKLDHNSLRIEVIAPIATLFFILVYGFSLVAMMLIFSLAAGWFSVSMTPSASSLVTVVYLIVVQHVMQLVMGLVMGLAIYTIGMAEYLIKDLAEKSVWVPLTIGVWSLAGIFMLALIIFLTFLVCKVTSSLGINAMGRARRPL